MKHLYIQFTAAPNGGEHIRKWSHERFDEANAYAFRIAGPDDVPTDEVEVAARAAARSLGFDFDEVCGHETEAEECDSSTCIGGMTEDHDPQFMRAYTALIDAPRRARTTGTLQQIIDAYMKSSAFVKLADRTKRDYLGHLDKIAVAKLTKNGPEFATFPLEAIESPKIRPLLLDWRDEMAKRSPRQADACFGVLRIILEWARDRGDISHNHATRPKKVYKADRSGKLWLPAHLDAFRKVAPADMVMAMELALWTGQRQADVLLMPWTAFEDGRLRFRQGKRQRLVDMPVYSELRMILDAAPRRAETILTTAKGKPWAVIPRATFFMHEWRQATLAAGLDGLHFHDIRGTTCTMLADAGCTPSEIAAYLGWTPKTVMEMLARYQAMTAAQSDSAVAKLEARRAE